MAHIVGGKPINSSYDFEDDCKFLLGADHLGLAAYHFPQIERVEVHYNWHFLLILLTVPVVRRYIDAASLFYVKDKVQFILERILRL